MVKLIATSPCSDLLPRVFTGVSVSEVTPEQITLVAPYHADMQSTSAVLEEALGAVFPAPNRFETGADGVRIIWCGPAQALVVDAQVPPLDGAAVVDQSDAWAIVRIKGEHAVAVLSRLTPIDLRLVHFQPGHTARTMLGHMTVTISRLEEAEFEVMAMRSMAGTLVHELEQAALRVSARAGL